MISQNYEKIVERISRETGLDAEEINRRVAAKRAKLSDLISKEGAAQVIAVELGINFDKPEVKINEILSGMRRIKITGKIIKIFPVRTYKTKIAESKVTSFVLADETGNIRCVLWDTNHIKLIEDGLVKEGSVVELGNASVREAGQDFLEVHLGSMCDFKLSDKKIENVITKQHVSMTTIEKIPEAGNARIRAVIVQMFEPRFFNVCSECNSKVVQESGTFVCAKHGTVIPKERAVLALVIDDGTGSIRASCFTEMAEKIAGNIQMLKNFDEFDKRRKEVVGKEYFFTGRTRKNVMYESIDFILDDLEQANPDEVIKMLQEK